ncbi:similar to Sm protein G [Cyanidioschyzon merolae strain 10D]|jgi:small nuclear ribonucleoprotein (snRNP)-like protein|uniref:Similar to Sm protein G n=1 Tax=Cyanidioschyzon merolae (strain NIES-3377 / 10D) TaxID=280699 RepID=M1V622_CYAM1|nr:similar to Sm protein G [Cyanidioschyzon merolae strain 10D]BAM81665.1 similar to Sm protein G [Cyanidioschyzon merolae strain 10D]|eukprot:XP_005537701.1 similar to Sm protein G [Cyanidioschyzon merolae strain 10D]
MAKDEVDTAELEALLFHSVQVYLNANRCVRGKLSGFDHYANLVLSDALDCRTGAQLGQVWIRGNSVVSVDLLRDVNADRTEPPTGTGSVADDPVGSSLSS